MNKLKYLRKMKNLKQTDVCNILHINQPNYSNYESGKIPLNMTYAKILAKYYNVTLGYLLDDNNEEITISKDDFDKLKEARDIINKLDNK